MIPLLVIGLLVLLAAFVILGMIGRIAWALVKWVVLILVIILVLQYFI